MNPERHAFAAAHLSDDDLDEVLMGSGSPDAEAHLAGCGACGDRLRAFQSTVALFSQASLSWSEAKSNTLTRDLAAHPATAPSGFHLTAAGSFATALVVAAGLLLSSSPRHEPASRDTAAATVSGGAVGSADREQEIAGDNAMMQAIDSALYRTEPSPLALYELDKPASASARQEPVPVVRD